jgi:hypothetical protein
MTTSRNTAALSAVLKLGHHLRVCERGGLLPSLLNLSLASSKEIRDCTG